MADPLSNELIAVFAKYWQPGRVKTRLAATIGDDRAAQIAHAFLTCLIHRFETYPSCKQIGFTPTERFHDFRTLAPSWALRPQADGDLGARMEDFFANAFREGHKRVVLLGADCPSVPKDRIQAALEQLESHDVVLGPADDGGYYLIGAKPPIAKLRPLLRHNRWGDSSVLERTLVLAERNGASVALLSTWNDVDDWSDLLRLRDDLEHCRECPHLINLRNRLQHILATDD